MELVRLPKYFSSVNIVSGYNVIKSFDGVAVERRRLINDKKNREVVVEYKSITGDELTDIERLYRRMKGGIKPFEYEHPTMMSWYDEKFGVGDGITKRFSLKSVDTDILHVYVDGVEKTNYSMSYGTGENGADEIIFDSAPASNALLTYDFVGRVRFVAHFGDNEFQRKCVGYNRFATIIRIVEE